MKPRPKAGLLQLPNRNAPDVIVNLMRLLLTNQVMPTNQMAGKPELLTIEGICSNYGKLLN